jgi:hypothetical protein
MTAPPPAGDPVAAETLDTADSAFQHLLGRPPSLEERQRLGAVRDRLGIDANDAVWLLFVAFEYYLSLYQRFPETIRAAAETVLVQYKTQTDETLDAAAGHLKTTADQLKAHLSQAARAAALETQAQLSATLTRGVRQAARHARRLRAWPWLLGGGVTVALALALGITVAYGYGRHAGYAAGHAVGYAEGWREAQARPATGFGGPPARP